MKNSVWTQKVKLPEYKTLDGDVKTDVLIIGGGIAGILCAYFLHKENIDYILVEGNEISSGITKNTTAKITAQHGLIYDKLIKDIGKEGAKIYLEKNLDAIKEYEKLCSDIDCDFEKKDAYTYSLYKRQTIEKEVKAVNSLGFPVRFEENIEIPLKIQGAVCFPNQAQFNPLKFISEISKHLNIYENTFIRDITPDTAVSNNGKITAKKIIVATHFPFINKHGSYFLKLYQHRSYVTAFENVGELKGMYVDEDLKGLSFRSYKNLMLIGGGSHRTGKHGGNWKEIENFAKEKYPDAKPKFRWATQDSMSLDSIPYIGKYSAKTPDLYVATGFNKWGFTSSMVAAKILCRMIKGIDFEEDKIFSPQRNIIKPQLFVNGFESAANLLTPTTKRCPHLGCALKWNKAEHSWDCPCHGSRFEENGKLIDNPATGDINLKD